MESRIVIFLDGGKFSKYSTYTWFLRTITEHLAFKPAYIFA